MVKRWWRGWLPLVVLPGLVLLLIVLGWPDWPRWLFMWTLAFAIYCGCKWLTWQRSDCSGVPVWKQAGYLLAWPGLDAPTFFQARLDVARPTVGEWLFAAGKLVLGLGILFGGARYLPADSPYLVGWVGMIGIVLILHFGTFHLLSCGWRSLGIDARPLMNAPLLAVSVSEFWGRRWNTAFRDLTHRFLFRPLTPRLGAAGAVFAGFVFSGVIHDVVISVPAGGGYGGPTVFFLVQGLAMLSERSKRGRRLGLGEGWRGWLFTLCVLLAPAYLLFHPPFVTGIVVPFMQAIGSLP